MKIPADAIIPEEKFTRYLLVKRDFDDKSQYLKKAGYTIEDWKADRDIQSKPESYNYLDEKESRRGVSVHNADPRKEDLIWNFTRECH